MSSQTSVTIPDEVATMMSSYLSLADTRLPGRISGLYLVGSLALDDYRSGQSDIDFVTVTDLAFTPSELTQLGWMHRELRRRRKTPLLDGVYVTWSELRAKPMGLETPYCHDSWFYPSGFAVNPVTWTTIHRRPISMRGPATPTIWHDDEALRQWCRENLRGYWTDWISDARNGLWRRLFSCMIEGVIWGVLGVTRLHATIKTGEIISKSAAGTYALEAFPSRWSLIINDALRGRLESPEAPRRNVFTRRRDALAFMEYVISDAS